MNAGLFASGAAIDAPAIIRQARAELRCFCPACVSLDLRFPGAGYQLAFWRYSPTGPMRLTRPTLTTDRSTDQ